VEGPAAWTAWQYAKRAGHQQVCTALSDGGAYTAAVPELSLAEKHGAKLYKVRKTPSWPRSWANFSFL
jgi:hypothetical protein